MTPTVLSEVEATLQAALVDLAGAMTIRNGRLVRPLSHSGFGPRPRVNPAQLGSTTELLPIEVPAEAAAELQSSVEDELAARRRTVAGRPASSSSRWPTPRRWRATIPSGAPDTEREAPPAAPGGRARCSRGCALAVRVRPRGRRGGGGGR